MKFRPSVSNHASRTTFKGAIAMNRPAEPMNEYTPGDLLGPLNEVEIKNAPEKLYVAGDKSLLARGARVSIVGARKASRRVFGAPASWP